MKILKKKEFFKLKNIDLYNKICIYPTETSYAISADIFNKEKLEKIYKIKNRDFSKKLSIIVSDLNLLNKWFVLSNLETEIINKYWPGALTLLLKAKNKDMFFNYFIGLNDRIAVRYSSNNLAISLANLYGGFIVATSANLSGEESLYSIKDLLNSFSKEKLNNIDYIIDAGILKKRKASSIILVENNKIKYIREGELKISL